LEGFVVIDYLARIGEAIADLMKWYEEGKLRYRVDVVEGLEQAPRAINKLFDGTNKGKLMVKV
jgi:NADPH-dependent curcumin reductase CurA